MIRPKTLNRRGVHFEAPGFGRVALVYEGDALVRLHLPEPGLGSSVPEGPEVEMSEANPKDPLVKALLAYFRGEAVDLGALELPIDWERFPPFTRQVYQELRQVPRGTTITYGELARRAGSPRAARGVGQVMSRNPLPLVIPCHRVVASGGGLGGFSSARGRSDKVALLELEGAPMGRTPKAG